MKQRILFLAAFIILSLPLHSSAQVSLSANLDKQPAWGPVGYDYVENYYIPDINVYYNVPQKLFVYNDRGNWVGTKQIPPNYKNFDLYHAYKVVINGPKPWTNHDHYYTMYSAYRPCAAQVVLRDADKALFRSRSYGGYMNGEYLMQGVHPVVPRGSFCGGCEHWDVQKEIINDQPRNPNE
jgi:hypothetical protein